MESNPNGRAPETRLTPNAVVAVDVVVFTLRPATAIEDRWQVLLVRRDEPAFGNKQSLPGVLVRGDETFDAAARRALQTKAGLDARDWYLEQLGTFGDPGRDTRGRVVSSAVVEQRPVPGRPDLVTKFLTVLRNLRAGPVTSAKRALRPIRGARRRRPTRRCPWRP